MDVKSTVKLYNPFKWVILYIRVSSNIQTKTELRHLRNRLSRLTN